MRELKAKDFYERGFVVVGSPKTVREQLLDGIKQLRMGHLLALLHFGSMPTELCKNNIDLFAREVLPYLKDQWDDEYEDRWWPARLRSEASGRRHGAPSIGCGILSAGDRHALPWICAGSSSGRIGSIPKSRLRAHGPPLVYLHGPWGLAPDRAFIARLAEGHTVFAPKFPGTSQGDPNSVHTLDNWHDLVVYYGELFDKLELSSPALVGHSFGGLLAAEIRRRGSRNRSAGWY